MYPSNAEGICPIGCFLPDPEWILAPDLSVLPN